jgi:very-short-patch-repair endonuclease
MPRVPHVLAPPGAKRTAPDRELAEWASERDGVASRKELLGLGFGRGAIRSHLANGQLHVIHHGVYAVGHRAISRRGYLRAALLACGEKSVLSHRTAADLWGISPTSSRLIEITGPTRRRGHQGLRYCQSRLHPDDIAEVEGFPVTSIARTLLDLAGIVHRGRVERALERAVRLRLFDLTKTRETIERNRGKKGCKLLTSVIASFDPATTDTRSGKERQFLRLIRNHKLPKPLLNTMVEGLEVDAFWPAHKLIVEIDTYATHGSQKAFHRDRERDAILFAAGHRVLRITDVQLDYEPQLVAQRVGAALAHQ